MRVGEAVSRLEEKLTVRLNDELEVQTLSFLNSNLPPEVPRWLKDDLLGFASKVVREPSEALEEIRALQDLDARASAEKAVEWLNSSVGREFLSNEAAEWAERELGADLGKVVRALPDITVQGEKIFNALQSDDPVTMVATLHASAEVLSDQLGLQSEMDSLQRVAELSSGNPVSLAKFALEELEVLKGDDLKFVNSAIEVGQEAALQFYSGNIPGAIASVSGAVGDLVGIEGIGGMMGGGDSGDAQRHAQVMARFDRLEAQIGVVDKRVQIVDQKLDRLYE